MEEITNKIYDYNCIIFDAINSLDGMKNEIDEKLSRCEYQIFHSIIEYIISNRLFKNPIKNVINNIHYNYFNNSNQLINIASFKSYIQNITQ